MLLLLIIVPMVVCSFAPSLEYFLIETLKGCTARVILNQDSYNTLLIFNKFNGYFEHESQLDITFIVQTFADGFDTKDTILQPDHNGLFYENINYTKPIWLYTKHTTCYSHLYFVNSWVDMEKAVLFHFVDFDLQKDTPNYIIFWQVDDFEIFPALFLEQEFYGAHMDYRLFVDYNYFVEEFEIRLMSTNGWVNKLTFHELSGSNFPSKAFIHSEWKSINSNHWGLGGFSCIKCAHMATNTKHRKQSFDETLEALLNSSAILLTEIGHFMYFGSLVVHDSWDVNLWYGYTPTSPSFGFSPNFVHGSEFQIFTVVRKSTSCVGWGTVIIPVPVSVWATILLGIISVAIILQNLQGKFVRLVSYVTFVLQASSPLTGHWEEIGKAYIRRKIMFAWSIFCLQLAVSYNAELTLFKFILNPPFRPTTLDELGSTPTALGSFISIYKDKRYPLFVHLLSELMEATQNHERQKMIQETAIRITKSFCSHDVALNGSNPDMSISCRHEDTEMFYQSEITFVEHVAVSNTFKSVFLASDRFYVSASSYLTEVPYQFPLLVQRNYFGKLVMPFASSWIESGLQQIVTSMLTMEIVSRISDKTLRVPEGNAASSLVLEFSPIKLSSLQTSLIVICFFTGMAIITLVVEITGHHLDAIYKVQ